MSNNNQGNKQIEKENEGKDNDKEHEEENEEDEDNFNIPIERRTEYYLLRVIPELEPKPVTKAKCRPKKRVKTGGGDLKKMRIKMMIVMLMESLN
jgi:hypothetical protein